MYIISFFLVPPKPSCNLGYISGKSDLRLDKIVFHWRCPAKKEEVVFYNRVSYIIFRSFIAIKCDSWDKSEDFKRLNHFKNLSQAELKNLHVENTSFFSIMLCVLRF